MNTNPNVKIFRLIFSDRITTPSLYQDGKERQIGKITKKLTNETLHIISDKKNIQCKWRKGQCYQNYICELQTILVTRIFIALWIYKQIIFCKLFFTKDFFPVVVIKFINLITLGPSVTF